MWCRRTKRNDMAAYLESVYSDETSRRWFFKQRSRQKSHGKTSFAQMLLVVFLAAACYFGISKYIVTSVEIVGTSMFPTLRPQDRFLLNRWVYCFHSPQRYDVVVLRDPSDNGYSVKRIVAQAGETVSFKRGSVYVNGKKLDEPYLSRDVESFPGKQRDQIIQCGKDQFVVLGDNRENSLDSRYYGVVPKQNILGMLLY